MTLKVSKNAKGYRGYIGSRPYSRQLPPQHIQNQIVRDHCGKLGLTYLLSLTEYAMADSYVILEEGVENIGDVDGLVLYSLFMLPKDPKYRESLVTRVLDSGASIHAAIENIHIFDQNSWHKADDLIRLSAICETTNFQLGNAHV